MMRTIARAAFTLFIAIPVAQAGDRVEFYADAAMIDCNIVDNAPRSDPVPAAVFVYCFVAERSAQISARRTMVSAALSMTWTGTHSSVE